MKTAAEFSVVGLIETYKVADTLKNTLPDYSITNLREELQDILNDYYTEWFVESINESAVMVYRTGRIYEAFIVTLDEHNYTNLDEIVKDLESRIKLIRSMIEKVI